MTIKQGMSVGSGCVFREDFYNYANVADNNGIVVASTVNRGISPLGVSARVTYDQTQGLLCNASKMTLALRFRTASVQNAGTKRLLCKLPLATTDNQFFVQFNANHVPVVFIAASAADLGSYFYYGAGFGTAAEIVMHAVFDGTLAAGSRGLIYVAGLAVATNVVGLPASMRASASPLTVFNFFGGNADAPDNSFLLREVQIFDFAMSPAEVADSYASIAMQEITPQ